MSIDDKIVVHDDYPAVMLEQPLTEEQKRKLGQLKWRWTIALNRAKSAPRTHFAELNKQQCEEVLALLDRILNASVTPRV